MIAATSRNTTVCTRYSYTRVLALVVICYTLCGNVTTVLAINISFRCPYISKQSGTYSSLPGRIGFQSVYRYVRTAVLSVGMHTV